MQDFLHQLSHLISWKITLVGIALFLIRVVILTALENLNPAHVVEYRKVLPRDFLVALVFFFFVLPAADFLDRRIVYQQSLPEWISEWPLALRILLYLVLADFGHYWVHRWLHTPMLWPSHRWHHSPTYMYWLAGTRGSVIQQALVNIPYIVSAAFVEVAPWWLAWAILLKNVAQNDFMHINLWWGHRWLEWIIVTPRYHHIHHSVDPAHFRGNLAALFPVWDHLFGTFIDPDKVSRNLVFGTGESIAPIRLAIGI
ncbi:sterol desaturase family protein [Bradyrhizobium cosmicum]|uniref:sterol desaturase family protein n=1 Tax=Bradyrhizobium cosmicum TaxID=1404864 RepID=UPI00068853D5|nr:sterol desaturase family protein [Bradyrhizobium cosmicum]